MIVIEIICTNTNTKVSIIIIIIALSPSYLVLFHHYHHRLYHINIHILSLFFTQKRLYHHHYHNYSVVWLRPCTWLWCGSEFSDGVRGDPMVQVGAIKWETAAKEWQLEWYKIICMRSCLGISLLVWHYLCHTYVYCRRWVEIDDNMRIILWYRPPELLLECHSYGKPVDIWYDDDDDI